MRFTPYMVTWGGRGIAEGLLSRTAPLCTKSK